MMLQAAASVALASPNPQSWDMSSSETIPLVNIGVSGWNYGNWRGKFYPEGLAKTRELEYMTTQFNTLEVNSSFYRLMSPNTWRKWGNEAPSAFQYSVKGWRQITHYSRLKDSDQHLATFLDSGPLQLEDKLGPFLWQLPPSLKFDAEVLDTFLGSLPRTFGEARAVAANAEPPPEGTRQPKTIYPNLEPAPADRVIRHVLEPRSEGFGSPEALAILREQGVALVHSDIAGRYPTFDENTTDLEYVRLHGSPRLYFSSYADNVLQEWAARIKEWLAEGKRTYFYFDNTGAGAAPLNAQELVRLVGAR